MGPVPTLGAFGARHSLLDAMHRTFPRTLEALADVFEFVGQAVGSVDGAGRVLPEIELAVEEIFANMVRHNPQGREPIRLGIREEDGGVAITLDDPSGDGFDPFGLPAVDVEAPLEARRPGGLGIHLVRRLADRYTFDAVDGGSRIILHKSIHPSIR